MHGGMASDDYSNMPAMPGVEDHEYQFYEDKQAPKISWRRAKRAVSTTTNLDPFVTIPEWPSRLYRDEDGWHDPKSAIRPLMGQHHNDSRIRRLCSTRPHGLDGDGRPWYVGVLYSAPEDPAYGFRDLVGIVVWVGHIACLLPGGNTMMRPLIELLDLHSRYFVVPLLVGPNDELFVVLPRWKYVQTLIAAYSRPHNKG